MKIFKISNNFIGSKQLLRLRNIKNYGKMKFKKKVVGCENFKARENFVIGKCFVVGKKSEKFEAALKGNI